MGPLIHGLVLSGSQIKPTSIPWFRDVKVVFLSTWIDGMVGSRGDRPVGHRVSGRSGLSPVFSRFLLFVPATVILSKLVKLVRVN